VIFIPVELAIALLCIAAALFMCGLVLRMNVDVSILSMLISAVLFTVLAFNFYGDGVQSYAGGEWGSINMPILGIVCGALALMSFVYVAWWVLSVYREVVDKYVG
jgi:hypothetical protein